MLHSIRFWTSDQVSSIEAATFVSESLEFSAFSQRYAVLLIAKAVTSLGTGGMAYIPSLVFNGKCCQCLMLPQ